MSPCDPGTEIGKAEPAQVRDTHQPAAMIGQEAQEGAEVLLIAAERELGDATLGAQPQLPPGQDRDEIGGGMRRQGRSFG